MSSIPDPYLGKLLKLRSEFIDLEGDPAEFDDLFNVANYLTYSQTSLCRRIFQQTFDLWSTGVKMEEISSIVAVLVDSIPNFSQYEKQETAWMVFKMVSLLPPENISSLVQAEPE